MNIQRLAMVVFLISLLIAATSARRHCLTLSATAKKPASLAGCCSLRPYISALTALFLLAARLQSTLRLLNFSTQTPSSR
jgi:hypothetical protein